MVCDIKECTQTEGDSGQSAEKNILAAEVLNEVGGNCMTRSFITFTLRQV
jgi:hypothetical protein